MNKLIKQLAEQCRIETYGVNGELLASDFDEQKFAELIVQECTGIDFYELLRSSCNKEQAEELADLISSSIRTFAGSIYDNEK